MSGYPGAIIYPAHPTNQLGPPPCAPKGWCLHTPEEPADNYPGTPYWFARPNVGGSTHYFVSYLGFVFQCVNENVGPIANGVTPDRDYPAWANENVSLNRQTLSVEIEGYAASIANTISPAQKAALVSLIRYGCDKYGIPKDRAHIIGHYEVASNRSDPGTLDIDEIVRLLQEGADEMNQAQTIQLMRDLAKAGEGFQKQEGALVRAHGTDEVYAIYKGERCWLTSAEIAQLHGMKPDQSNVNLLEPISLLALRVGKPIIGHPWKQ